MPALFDKICTIVRLAKGKKLGDVLLNKPRLLNHQLYMKKLSMKIADIDENDFYIKADYPCINNLFEYDKDEEQRIKKGERKILFYCDENKKLDIKSLWESNRLHELVPYVSCIDGTYYYDFIESSIHRIEDSVFENTNAMEIAISAINVIEACKATNQKKILQHKSVCCYLKECLIYILQHSEKKEVYSANHYFFDLIGALWIINHCIGEQDNSLALYLSSELESVLEQIISMDGSLYEGSTFYHRYVTESLLAYLYCNTKYGNKYLSDKVKKMTEFIVSISDEDTIFGFGDNDSGRILPIPKYFEYASRNIFSIKKLYGVLYGEIKSLDAFSYLDYFGIIVYRFQNYSIAFRVDEGRDKKKNKYIGGHIHNDLLAVELKVFHKDVIVNKGTYLYIQDGNCRYHNLCTKYQSTVSIAGEEQNIISNGWEYKERKQLCKLLSIYTDNVVAKFEYKSGITHTRSIRMTKYQVKITDIIDGSDEKNIDAFFYLSHNVVAEIIDKKVVVEVDGHEIIISTDGNICLEDCEIYPEYGMRVQSKVVKVSFLDNTINTVFCINK